VATGNVILEVTADGFTSKQVPVLGATTALQLSVVIVKTAPPPPPATRMIGGVVSDATTHRSPATVRVHGTEVQTVTAGDGSFTLPGVAINDVTLDIEAPNQPADHRGRRCDKAAVAMTGGVQAARPCRPRARSGQGARPGEQGADRRRAGPGRR